MDKAIFYPMLVMMTLTVSVIILLAYRRLGAMKSGETKSFGYFRTFAGNSPEPVKVQVAQRNFTNLFELPVLFYVVCLAAAFFDRVDTVSLSLAWTYVALRGIHSFVHLTRNNVQIRFIIFSLSLIPLVALWIWVAI